MPQSDFERLVRDHHQSVWLAARRVLRSDEDAQDATQEVFLRVLDGRLRLDPEADPRRVLCWWSIRIALNADRGARRRREREDRHAMDDTRNESVDPDAARIWPFVEDLPDDLRVPVVLRFAEGYGFADIGDAIGVAESTAHERVQRGLAKLRAALKRAGFGALALDVETGIGRSAPSAAPDGLAHSLLALEGTAAAPTATVATFGLVASVTAAVGAVVVAAVWLTRPDETGGEPSAGGDVAVVAAPDLDAGEPIVLVVEDGEPAGRVAIDAPSSSGFDLAELDDPADDVFGRVAGRVVDAEGAPVADCDVSIYSVERSGKMHAYCAKARTDVNGRFATRVEVADAEGGHYRAQVARRGYSVAVSPAKLVRAEAVTDFGDLAMRGGAELREGDFQLDVSVVDREGRPVPDARVVIASVVDLPVLPGTSWSDWLSVGDRLERTGARASTDTGGIAHLKGAELGGKSLRITPPNDTFAPQLVRFDVAAPGATSLLVVLDPGLEITGRMRVVGETMTPAIAKSLRAVIVDATTAEWRFADVAEDGAFRFGGLASGVHRVRASTQSWMGDAPHRLSPAWLDVEAGTLDVDIALKHEHDTRDIGLHGAEIHGRLVRAEDGEPQPVSWWSVGVHTVDAPDGADVERDWLPNHIFPRPVQVAADGSIPEDSDVFHRTGLSGGRLLLRCMARDRAMLAHGPIELGEREIVRDLVLELQPPGVVRGSVLDAKGRRVDGAYVFLTGIGPISDGFVDDAEREYREADGRGFFFVNGTGTRSKRGKFEIGALPPDVTFRTVAVHPKLGRAFGPQVTLRPGETVESVTIRYGRPR